MTLNKYITPIFAIAALPLSLIVFFIVMLMISINSTAAIITLDNFNSGPVAVSDSTVDSSGEGISVLNPTGAIGGETDIFVFTNNKLFPTGSTSAEIAGGFYSFNSGSGVSGYGKIQWDGLDNSPNLDVDGLGSVDFLSDTDGLAIDLAFSDMGFIFTLDIYTNGGAFNTLASFESVGFTDGGTRFIAWDDPEFFGIDLTDVSAIEATINPLGLDQELAVDLTIETVRTTQVPEPGSLALMGMACFGLFGANRVLNRRK